MENASKALIMVATILLGLMIIAFMVYMFNDASKINKRQELRENEKRISAFNSDFLTYETTDTDIVAPNTGNLFRTAAKKTYSRFNAASELNKISDVISAVNDAHDINYTNNNEYKNNFIEYTNSMVIVLDLRTANLMTNVDSGSKTKYVIFPHKRIEPGYLYGMNDSEYDYFMKKIENHESEIDLGSVEYNKVEISKFLEFFRESRLATVDKDGTIPDNKNYTLYKYYFTGKLNLNEITGKVDRITFTLVEDKDY